MTKVGIEKINFYSPDFYLDLAILAEKNQQNPSKYYNGLGQKSFCVASLDEDIVTMAVSAAKPMLNDADIAQIDTIILATETGIDQSKAAAIWVHKLLNLNPNCRAIEVKQACYSATFALQMASNYVKNHIDKKVLLIASDLSRYQQNTPAEATQGAAAVALLVSSQPNLAQIDDIAGIFTEDVMDFYRPNNCSTPIVDGKFSTQIYLKAVEKAYDHYQKQGGLAFNQFAQYCYHLPFTKMGQKAHEKIAKTTETEVDLTKVEKAMVYNRQIGNSYTASLYLSLCSAVDLRDDLAGQSLAMVSYGSGCVAEFFRLIISENYQENRPKIFNPQPFANRKALDFDNYNLFWNRIDNQADAIIPQQKSSGCRLHEIRNYQRQYQL